MGPIINTDAPGPIVRQCTGTSRRTGKRCTRSAMKGQSVCYTHGGAAKQNRRAAARRLALGEARAELTRMGVPIEVDPAEAMLEMVCEAAGNVAFLRGRVADLRPDLGTDGLAGNIGSTAKENEAAPSAS
jgi:hypothetical protein